MKARVRSSLCVIFVPILAGCFSSGEDDLRLWMAEQRATAKPAVTPLTEPKKFVP